MRRVLVVGITGVGKSTAARAIAQRVGVPFHELDALAFGPGWTRPPNFARTVRRLTDSPGWVFDSWGYPEVRDLLWSGADTVVWLDFPRRTVLPRVLRRSLRRSASRAEIFGGNRETWRGWFDAEHPVWWSMSEFGNRRRDIAGRIQAAPHLHTVRLTTPHALQGWLARLRA